MPTPPPRRRSTRTGGRELAAIFAGGSAGALARTVVVQLGADGMSGWPWGTFAVNLGGCLLLGLVVTRLHERRRPARYLRPLLGTGFCGALTTFSTLQLQLLSLLDRHRWALALGYVGVSLGTGLLGVAAATALARRRRTFA